MYNVINALNDFQVKYDQLSNYKIIRAPESGVIYIDSESIDKRMVIENEHIMSLIPMSNHQKKYSNYVLVEPRRINDLKIGFKILIFN